MGELFVSFAISIDKFFDRTSSTFSSMDRRLKVLDVGGGDGSRAREEFFPFDDVTTIDVTTGWDVMEKGLPNGDWDVVFANHFIEHIVDPDYFLDECKRVMSEDTVLNIGTPNLTAWFNRVFFLFGYVPHSMELSTRFNVGKPLNWNEEPLGGHLRIYTLDGLCDLLKHHGFTITETLGERSTYPCNHVVRTVDGLLTKLNPSLASALRVKCQY